MRYSVRFAMAAMFAACCLPAASLQIQKHPDGRIEILEDGRTALIYNSAPMLSKGAPEDSRRCCYIFPLNTPAGVPVLDDFPQDHWHHRGIFWAWPVVETSDGKFDLWMMRGVETRTEQAPVVEQKADRAGIRAGNGWYAKGRRIVREQVWITLHPFRGDVREFDVELRLEATGGDVTLRGSQEKGKSYGGLNARFAPRTGTILRADGLNLEKDEDRVPRHWAELEAVYPQGRAALRVTPDSSNPGTPYQWCLRAYGFIGAAFPGNTPHTQSYTLVQGKPLTMKFRVQVRDVR